MPKGAAAIARNGWATAQYSIWQASKLPAWLRYPALGGLRFTGPSGNLCSRWLKVAEPMDERGTSAKRVAQPVVCCPELRAIERGQRDVMRIMDGAELIAAGGGERLMAQEGIAIDDNLSGLQRQEQGERIFPA